MYKGSMAVVLLFAILAVLIPGYLTSIIRPIKSRSSRSSRGRGNTLLEFDASLEGTTKVNMFQTTYLECSVKADPPALIYWLKNGRRITNDTHHLEDRINSYVNSVMESDTPNVGMYGRSMTKSRLAIRCARPRDEGVYQCVADNGDKRSVSETQLEVLQSNEVWAGAAIAKHCSSPQYMSSAKVNTWSDTFAAIEGSTIRLICRASGKPQPKITWYVEREEGLCKIHNSNKYQTLKNGDLIIFDLSWESDMGQFMCSAQNDYGSENVSTFVYVLAK